MKAIKLSFVLVFFILTNACGQEVHLKQVHFLAGTWKMEAKENYESWEKLDNKLVGESFKIRNGEKHISETIEINIQNNAIVYTPTVFNQNEGKGIPFVLKSNQGNLFSFENVNHDFPKKIQYKILSETELYVSVLGDDDKGFSYTLIKQSNK